MLSTNCVEWRYLLDQNYTWESGLKVEADWFFRDSNGMVRLVVEKGGRITVTRGYAWNGCSPTFLFMDLLIGTPDGAVYRPTGRPKAYYASLVHDALYQFLAKEAPVTRPQADRIFRQLLAESEFRWRWLYWFAVRVGGWMVWKATSMSRNWKGEASTL